MNDTVIIAIIRDKKKKTCMRLDFMCTFYLFLWLLVCIKVACTNGVGPCDEYYGSDKDRWLIGETIPVTFPLQLVAVLSYAPITFVLQTHLVVNSLYSTSVAPRNGSALMKKRLTPVPFSTFFDHDHFVWYWSQHKLQVIDYQDYFFCFGRETSPYNHSSLVLKRIPDFSPFHPHEFAKLFLENNLPITFPNHQRISFDGKYKMIGLYNFWNDPTMLSYVYQSLKPAKMIEQFSNALLSVLTNNFMTIHLRVDEEAFPTSSLPSSTGEKSLEFLQLINTIKFSTCFKQLQHINHELFIDPPTIYLITNVRAGSKDDKKKVKAVIDELHSLGFLNIYTRRRIVDRFCHFTKKAKTARLSVGAVKDTSSHIGAMQMQMNLPKLIEDLHLHEQLSPEQLQYVDILVGRSSSCFIPSFLPTLLSYIIKRFNRLEHQQPEDFGSVNRSTYGSLSTYRDWGI